jgi:hypothetical protein
MSRHSQPRFWRLCRIYFRRFRIFVWLVILMLLGILLYLNQVGLPEFVKRPILEKLRARGLDLQFSRLRLRFYQGMVADNVRFGRLDDPLSPRLTLGELQVGLNYRALTRFQFQIDSVILRQGRLLLPLGLTNGLPRQLSVEKIGSELRFLPHDLWALDNFKAAFAGAEIRLSGIVTNASAVRDLKLFQSGHPVSHPVALWQNRLRELADALERIRFSAPPELTLDLRGDARELQSFSLVMLLTAPGADTPWGAVSKGRFAARLNAADTNGSSRADVKLEAADAQTRWGAISNLLLTIHLSSHASPTNPVNGDLTFSALQAHTPWGNGSNPVFTAHWLHSITNPVPLAGHGEFSCAAAQTEWASANRVEFSADLATPAAADLPADAADWGWWTNIESYAFAWHGRLLQLHSTKIEADELACGGEWHAPQLTVTNLQGRLYGGQLAAHAQLDVATRALSASCASDFDIHRIGPLLTEGGRRWLDDYAWETPPRLQADISLVLPAWNKPRPDWRREVQPGLNIKGEFNLERGGVYHQIRVTTARSHFAYSNMCWDLPDLTLTRPEGGVAAVHHANDRTRQYHWHLASTIDVRALRPLLDAQQQHAFELLTFSQPPVLDADIWGRFNDHDHIGFKGRVALTNFAFRGEAADSLQTGLKYTNGTLWLFQPRIQIGTQYVSADGLAADFKSQRIYLTNGYSTADPGTVTRAIGPHIARTIEPYQFLRPPIAHVHGIIPMRNDSDADLFFDVEGGPFQWWKFHVPHLSGHLHWLGDRLLITSVRADLYQGRAEGWATFDFLPRKGTGFQFALTFTNTLLQGLMADLSTHSNHLEGRLSGALVVTSANTERWQAVQGYGDASLRDGLIWDIPLFGIFTPVLNGIMPGLGNSRATAAACTFTVTNGIVRSDDLEIRSPAMRLEYRGNFDLAGRLNARVEAGLLRDMWVVGPLVSTVLWPVTKMFEYKVTGDLHDPKTEPVFIIPRIVLFPFHPLRALKGLVPEENKPPLFTPPPDGAKQ